MAIQKEKELPLLSQVLALPKEKIPQHIAIILDGNGRWAQAHGVGRTRGHLAGADNVEAIVDACIEAGVKYLTLYAFSTENWKRSEEEVSYLMMLLKRYLIKNKKDALARSMQVRVIGDKNALSKDLQELIVDVEESTAQLNRFHLTFAINYGGRDELVRAFQKLSKEGVSPEEITAEKINEYLDTAGMPDPDLMVRTSGEERISNFLLWQVAYSEFYFTEVYWPDFSPTELHRAILNYASRERRFGGRLKK